MQPAAQILQGQFQERKSGREIILRPSSQACSVLPIAKPAVMKSLKVLSQCFPDLDLTAERVEFMYESLKDLTQDQLFRGIRGVTRGTLEKYGHSTNLVAHIRKYGLGHDKQITAGEAWGEVIEKMKNPVWVRASDTGTVHKKPPVFSDELIEKTVKIMGGMSSLENSTNPIADRAHFTEIYEGLREKKNISEMLGE